MTIKIDSKIFKFIWTVLLFASVLWLGHFEEVLVFYKSVLFDSSLQGIIVVFLSMAFIGALLGLCFCMYFFSCTQKGENIYLDKLMEEDNFNFFIKPMYGRFISLLYWVLITYVYLIFIKLLSLAKLEIDKDYEWVVISSLFCVYAWLAFRFVSKLRILLRSMKSMSFISMRGLE